jgi:two-component system phosphate regulon sensor histidine kinase PhoR
MVRKTETARMPIPLNRFQRPRKWIQISLRSAVPAWAVLGLFVFGGSLSFRYAILGSMLAAALAGLLAWRPARLRDALRRRIDALASDTADAGRPVASDGLNRAFDRLVRVWRERAARLAAEVSEQPRVIDILPDPMLLIAADRRVSHANRAARELAGIDLKGYDLASGLRNPQLIAAVDAVLAGGSGQSLEVSFPVPVERHFAVRVEPLGEDLPDAAVAVFHDLTALEQTERMRADFVANVSHELKTPLASLVGYIETLQGSAKDDAEARVRFLKIMEDQAQRMSRLVDDLLSLARIEMDEHSRPTARLALGPLLQEVANALEPQAAKREVDLSLEIATDLPQLVADRDQLSEVFENLIGNAIRYGRAGGKVRVTARPEPRGNVTIAVEDEGEGIAAEHIPRLTERFYRVDPARSRERGGTGLGLAIVKHIVSRHRGRLAVESEPGQGSRFSVILPVEPAPEDAATREEPAAI